MNRAADLITHAMTEPAEKKKSPRSRRLVWQATCAYAILILYVSLHPLSGWRGNGLPLFFFLNASWPRYWTGFDLFVNALAYLPLGYLLTLSFWRSRWHALSALLAFLLASTMSLCVETIQAWLPSRVPSNLDLACNSIGAGLGALFALWKGEQIWFRLAFLLRPVLSTIKHAEFGLVLIALWLFAQLSPEIELFGTGDVRHFLDIVPPVPYNPPAFFAIEAAITACNMVAIGLMMRMLLAAEHIRSLALPALFILALLVRTLSAAILIDPANAFAWFTPGSSLGLLIGGLFLVPFLFLPHSLQLIFAALLLMAGTMLVNVAPTNPYSIHALSAWRQGHFLNFNGLTRVVGSLWPFITMPYLMWMLGRQDKEEQGENE